MTLGIIGTAGRGQDGVQFLDNPAYWRMMKVIAQTVATMLQPERLVSGGAAFSDHLAVQLYLEGFASDLTLHLPADWLGHGFKEVKGSGNLSYDPGRTSNYYHGLFSRDTQTDTLAEIQAAIEKGATVKTGAGGFKERNTDIANEASTMLAFTFGQGAALKDGGTKDTWVKFGLKAQREWDRYHAECQQGLYDSPCGCSCGSPEPDWFTGYHFDLTTRRLYRHVFEDKRTVTERAEQAAEAAAEEERKQPTPPKPRTPEEERLFLL